jgi:hypothetical protein
LERFIYELCFKDTELCPKKETAKESGCIPWIPHKKIFTCFAGVMQPNRKYATNQESYEHDLIDRHHTANGL